MAKPSLNLEDLLKAQQKLREAEALEKNQLRMSASDLPKLSKGSAPLQQTGPEKERVKKQDKLLKDSLEKKTGDGLNSNVIKMYKEIKKSNELSKDMVKGILDKNRDMKPEFKTIGQRIRGKVEGVKDFFTARGFLDKTGIVKKGTGGIADTFLARREYVNKYANMRNEMDPYKNLVGDKAAKSKFRDEAKEQLALRNEQGDLERKLAKARELGISEKSIDRSKETKRLTEIGKRLPQIDPALRPEGYDPKTGKVKSSMIEALRGEKTGSQKNKESNIETENKLEGDHYQDETIELLKKIEENTRGGGGGGKKDGGGGIFSGLGGKIAGAGDALKKIGIGMLAFGAALWVTAKAFQEFAKLNWAGFTKGLIALGGMVLAAIGLSKAKGDIMKGALALGVLDLAIWGMSKALEGFASLDWATIGKAFATVGGFALMAAVIGEAIVPILLGSAAIGVLGAALWVFGKGLDSIAEGMKMFVDSLTQLSKIDALNLALIGPALVSVAAGMAAMGAGSAVAGVGNLVGKLLNFGGPSPIDQVIELGKAGAGVEKAGTGLTGIATAMKGFAGIKKSDMDAINAFPWTKATLFAAAGGSMSVDGNKVYNASKNNEDKKAANDAERSGGNTSVVNAPTTIKQTSNNLIKLPVRDEDTTIQQYYRSRFAY
jgi:hypothetical protein